MKTVAVSGYFDPLHVGHIELFKLARALGDKLVVILNNDKQIEAKKGKCFMPAEQRKIILEELRCVDEVFLSIDEDRSICKSLRAVHPDIFANGGDRKRSGVAAGFKDSTDIPEIPVCEELGIEIVEGLGKKIQSSSELVKKYNEEEKE